MNKKISFLLMLAVPMLLFSCKKCYDCEDYDYCYECTISNSSGSTHSSGCSDTPQERDAEIEDFKDFYSSLGTVTCTKSQERSIGFDIEVCDKKKDAESEVQDLEDLGYICKEQ